MSSTSNDIAITGANGFVGKNLRNFLHKKKINVLGISRKNFRKHPSEIKIISTNISDPKLQTKLKNYDALINLIGIGRQTPKSTDRQTGPKSSTKNSNNFGRRTIFLPTLLSRKTHVFNAKIQFEYLCRYGPDCGYKKFDA